MFTFLSPLGLWLGALLAVPLVIHFLGRQRLRKEPFPSLLLLEERLAKSMHRHRLKNLLLLLIRTLLILCLFLALGNPAWERRAGTGTAGPGVDAAAALVHNGAFGLLPAGPGGARASVEAGGRDGSPSLSAQRRRLRALDSALGTRVQAVPLLADGPGAAEAAARHGNHGEAVDRLLAAVDPRAATSQVYLPVYAWADLAPAREALAAALKERPGLQVVLWDFGEAGSKLNAFSGVRSLPSSRAPTVTLRALLSPPAVDLGPPKVRTSLETRVLQEIQPDDDGLAEVTVPLAEGARTAGKLTALVGDAAGFAVADWHFSFPNPGRLTLVHVGSALASLPSLGRENYFRRIVHVAAARDIPWPGPAAGGTAAAGGAGRIRLVYLSNERNTDAAAYGRLVEYVKRGGRLIVGVGRESDIPLLNRFLLQPLRMGRLGAAADVQGRAEPDAKGLARLGGLPAEPGPLGQVRRRFAFAPDSGTRILVRQGGEPLLALRDFHEGKALLWTTDLDDLEWSDIGVAPLVPLLHQAFQEGGGGLTANRAVASDSVMEIALPEPGTRVEVRDPDGRPFTRVRADGARLRVGPFDRLGQHTAAWGRDTLAFAVNLEPRGPAQERKAGDWAAWNKAGREEFLRALAPFGNRVIVAPPDGEEGVRASVRPLWKAFFLAAILLLFLEGLIASAFSPTTRGGKPA